MKNLHMNKLHINKHTLLNALTELNHVGMLAPLLPWKVAVNSKLPIPTGRIIFANTCPMEAYSLANKTGEVNYSLDVFLDGSIETSYVWDDEYPTSFNDAYNELARNLASIVTLGGETFSVIYKEEIVIPPVYGWVKVDGTPSQTNVIPNEVLEYYMYNAGDYDEFA